VCFVWVFFGFVFGGILLLYMFEWDVHVSKYQCNFLAEKPPYIYVLYYFLYHGVQEIRSKIGREQEQGTLVKNLVRFCGKIILGFISKVNVYYYLAVRKTVLGNAVPVIVVVWGGIQIPHMQSFMIYEIFRGVQEIDVEMADAT